MADQLAGRAAEQRRHPRGDVDHAVLAIDLPEPADAAMFIFPKQQPDRFRLGPDTGHLPQRAIGPAGEAGDAQYGDRSEADGGQGQLRVDPWLDETRTERTTY